MTGLHMNCSNVIWKGKGKMHQKVAHKSTFMCFLKRRMALGLSIKSAKRGTCESLRCHMDALEFNPWFSKQPPAEFVLLAEDVDDKAHNKANMWV